MSLVGLVALLPVVVSVLYGLGLVASAIAAVTKNTKDDELAAWVVWLHDFLVKFVPNGAPLADKRSVAPSPPAELPPVVHPR